MFNGHDIMPCYHGEGDDTPNPYYKEPPPPVYVFGVLKSETEKAILFDLMAFEEYGHKYEALPRWIPKSQLAHAEHSGEPYFEGFKNTHIIRIPDWLFKKIKAETKLIIATEDLDEYD